MIEVATGRTIREMRSVPGPTDTSFSPSGDRIAVASESAPLAKVISVDTGDDLLTLEGHIHVLSDVAWSPDGRLIATSGTEGSARVWDARTGAQRFALLGHEAWVNNVDWSPDSGHLATASDDGTVKVWQLIEGGPRQLFTLSAHDMREGVIGVAFSPDGSRLMTGDTDVSATQVWDVSINGDAEVANLAGVSYHYGSATYTPDGRHVIASSVGNSVTVWDPHTVRTVRTLGDGPPPEVKGVLAPTVPTGLEVGAVAVSPDGRAVAAVTYADGAFVRSGGDDIVRTWDLTAGEATLSLQPGGEIVGSAWDPDGELLALTLAEPGRADRVAVFDPTGEEVAQLQAEPPTAFGEIAFSLDGRRLLVPRLASEASDTETRGVDVWDWRRGEVVDTIKTPHGYGIVSPTGIHLALFPYDQDADSGGVELWDIAAGRRLATLSDVTGNVAFSADGTTLLTGANDGIVRVWDVEHARERLALEGHVGAISDVNISPDGAEATTVGADGVVRIWTLRLDDLVAIAEDGLTRTLTSAECRRYLHVDRCEPT